MAAIRRWHMAGVGDGCCRGRVRSVSGEDDWAVPDIRGFACASGTTPRWSVRFSSSSRAQCGKKWCAAAPGPSARPLRPSCSSNAWCGSYFDGIAW